MESRGYSALDRLTHRIAFAHRGVQEVLADIELQLWGREWRDLPLQPPVFVTSLPRAGTTLLLEVLARLSGVATHTYRDMPFVRAPILWRRLSGRHRTGQAAAERAHGDGILIGPDSPEAFEEVLWLARFPGHFATDGIRLWTQPEPKFAAELADHMRRILLLRRGEAAASARYVSKNNANIARLPLLRAAFPEAQVLVPLRDPLAQARSMHRQHLRFAERHRTDAFGRRYMADIGHFEFGAAHRPILFEGMAGVAARFRPDQLEYWVGYWTAAYRHLAGQEGITFLDHAGFCRDAGANFPRLCAGLGLAPDPAAVAAAVAQTRPEPRAGADGAGTEGLDAARALFARLQAASLFAAPEGG